LVNKCALKTVSEYLSISDWERESIILQYEWIKYPYVAIPAMFGLIGYHHPEALSSAAPDGGQNA
jgi:hypothetical protein